MNSKLLLGLVAFIIVSFVSSVEETELVFNEDNRLQNNLFVVKNTPKCIDYAQKLDNAFPGRTVITVSSKVESELFAGHNSNGQECSLLCLEKGSNKQYINNNFPERYYTPNTNAPIKDGVDWYREWCMAKEVGFVSRVSDVVDIYWVNGDQKILLSQVHTVVSYSYKLTIYLLVHLYR